MCGSVVWEGEVPFLMDCLFWRDFYSEVGEINFLGIIVTHLPNSVSFYISKKLCHSTDLLKIFSLHFKSSGLTTYLNT
jgi:hypothetical protein